jgi:hypothetical protein
VALLDWVFMLGVLKVCSMIKLIVKGGYVNIFSTPVQLVLIFSLKSDLVKVFTLWKLATTKISPCPCVFTKELVLRHLPVHQSYCPRSGALSCVKKATVNISRIGVESHMLTWVVG